MSRGYFACYFIFKIKLIILNIFRTCLRSLEQTIIFYIYAYICCVLNPYFFIIQHELGTEYIIFSIKMGQEDID